MAHRRCRISGLVLALVFGISGSLGAGCGGEIEDEPEHRVHYQTSTGEEVTVEGEDEDEIEENMETVEEHLEDRDESIEESFD
jgi:hypothetical protein